MEEGLALTGEVGEMHLRIRNVQNFVLRWKECGCSGSSCWRMEVKTFGGAIYLKKVLTQAI